MALECREIVDSLKETPKVDKCHECEDLQRQFAENPGRKSMNRTGLVIAAITGLTVSVPEKCNCYSIIFFSGGSALGLSAICLPFVTPALRRVCLPYVPATTTQIANIQTALKRHGHKNGSKRLVDIGSGDGRIVHTVAQNGYIAHGIELNPWLVLFSKVKSLQLGLRGKATFSRQDLWKANLGQYDNVVIFGVEQMVFILKANSYYYKHQRFFEFFFCFRWLNWKPSWERK
jgi:2-polyprenyl-3-methyl-5-hydroxy-6-metoxy-1,4-benzoquinol methylase